MAFETDEPEEAHFEDPVPKDVSMPAVGKEVFPPLPPPEIATFRREDFDLPFVFTGCESLADCAGE